MRQEFDRSLERVKFVKNVLDPIVFDDSKSPLDFWVFHYIQVVAGSKNMIYRIQRVIKSIYPEPA